jgi:hypothetical protein
MNQRYDRAAGALLGLAVGDAVGTTLEFSERDTLPPLTDMIGGGLFGLNCASRGRPETPGPRTSGDLVFPPRAPHGRDRKPYTLVPPTSATTFGCIVLTAARASHTIRNAHRGPSALP